VHCHAAILKLAFKARQKGFLPFTNFFRKMPREFQVFFCEGDNANQYCISGAFPQPVDISLFADSL